MAARNNPCCHFTYHLRIYDFLVHNFYRTCPDAIYSADPWYLIDSFQFLGDAPNLNKLLNNGIQPLLCPLVNIGKVAIQLAVF